MFNEAPRECRSYSSYISRIEEGLMDDLRIEYQDVPIRERDFVTEQDKGSFTRFLSNLLKDKAYVEMAYMTSYFIM